VVSCALGYSRVGAGALIFAKQAPDILWGMGRCLAKLGALPETVVWDREAAIAPRGRPTEAFAAFCGALAVGWSICEAADPESKGVLERSHRFLRSNFEPARSFASPEHFQAELDAWFERANTRLHRGIRAVPAERLAAERQRMRALPERMPATERRFVTRVPQQPYLRFDTNDYSLDPRAAGRRVEVRANRYGRLLAYAMRGGVDLNRAQVHRGWAKVYVYAGVPFRRVRAYRRAAATARSGDRGVWRLCGGDFHSAS
jgi:Mu transposase, C-terminal domain/Staphylococcal nuclease homologue